MDIGEILKLAIELGVIPALALFLVAAMFVQNRQLLRDRREMEMKLLSTISEILVENQKAVGALRGGSGRQGGRDED